MSERKAESQGREAVLISSSKRDAGTGEREESQGRENVLGAKSGTETRLIDALKAEVRAYDKW
ncbi:MAG: hypothetical protein K5989_12540 [Lachnospiraceae bacterium]|nr:hypothetical protein [Lachnospiraceae bacterium]